MSGPWRTLLMLCVVVLATAIDPGTARAESSSTTVHDAQEVRQTVNDVLADPEYRHLHDKEESKPERTEFPQWLKDFLEWLFEDDSTSQEKKTETVFSFGEVLYYLALAALAVALVYLVVAIIRSSDGMADVDPSEFSADAEAIIPTQPPGDVPTNEYERRALAAAQAGDFRSGLRELVLGSMSWTERAGLVRYRRGLTNRDYVRAVWRMADRRESLLQISAAFERVFYGRRVADEATFESCLVEFRQSFLTEANHAQPSN
jgi:hypothetical protein